MAYHGISRLESGDVDPRRNPPAHDAWQETLLTGLLELRLQTLAGHVVSPGTGRLTLMDHGDGEVVVQEAAKLGGSPVLPGSGIKGAVRTVYEVLSHSCDPNSRRDRCRTNLRQEFSDRRYCDACSLFGCMGWRGRVTFSDAKPESEGAVDAGVHWFAMPYKPDAEKTPGDFRFYDLDGAVHVDRSTGRRSAASKDLAREAYQGRFITRLNFWNVSAGELGRLLLAMGLAGDDGTAFPLRLGGGKYDGEGPMNVEPVSARLVTPERRAVAGESCRELCAGWLKAARESSWNADFGGKLRELAKVTGTGKSEPWPFLKSTC